MGEVALTTFNGMCNTVSNKCTSNPCMDQGSQYIELLFGGTFHGINIMNTNKQYIYSLFLSLILSLSGSHQSLGQAD